MKIKIKSGKYKGEKLSTLKKKVKNFIYSTAVGKFQFNEDTLSEYQKKCGFKDSDIFSPSNQDKLAYALLKSLGIEDFKVGKISKWKFQMRLSCRWASIAHPSTGKSRYGQKTGISTRKIRLAMTKYLLIYV